jgi:hypothetical protein
MSRQRDAYHILGQLAQADTPEARAALARLVTLGRSVVTAVNGGHLAEVADLFADYEGKLLLSQALPWWEWEDER